MHSYKRSNRLMTVAWCFDKHSQHHYHHPARVALSPLHHVLVAGFSFWISFMYPYQFKLVMYFLSLPLAVKTGTAWTLVNHVVWIATNTVIIFALTSWLSVTTITKNGHSSMPLPRLIKTSSIWENFHVVTICPLTLPFSYSRYLTPHHLL